MMKIIYAGTPDFAVPALEALLQSEHEVIAVYTQPDRPAGRGRKIQQSLVKQCALTHHIPVFQPSCLKQLSDINQLIELKADLMVVAAYGLILPSAVLSAPRFGCINIHGSLLPRWRGAAPIQRAILAGDSTTGITIMQMDAGLDTGDMLAKKSLPIEPHWTSFDLQLGLQQLGADLLMDTLTELASGKVRRQPQDELMASYASKLSKSEARIDWNKPSLQLLREIKAFVPWPVSYTQLDHKRVRIWSAAIDPMRVVGQAGEVIDHDTDGIYVSAADGVICIQTLQFEGKKQSTAAQVLNGQNLIGRLFL